MCLSGTVFTKYDCYLLPAICHLLYVTCSLLLAICYLLYDAFSFARCCTSRNFFFEALPNYLDEWDSWCPFLSLKQFWFWFWFCYLLLAIRHLLSVTCYLSLVIYHLLLLLAICYMVSDTFYRILAITCFLSLVVVCLIICSLVPHIALQAP